MKLSKSESGRSAGNGFREARGQARRTVEATGRDDGGLEAFYSSTENNEEWSEVK